MLERVVLDNERVVVLEVVFSSVVGRINVDNINFTGMGVGEFGKCGEVVALDYDVIRSVGIA